MSQKNNIEIIISAVDNISKTLQDTSKKLTGFVELNEINFRKMHDVGSRVFQGLASNILEFTDSSAKLQEASSAMDQLAKNIGQNSQDIMQSLRTASKGTIADYDLVLAANKAMSLGVAKNTEEFTTLMEIARAKSKNMGISTTQAFSDIVTGLGRGSAQILDNLGIVISASDAYEEYAKSIGKSAKELTDAEKKQVLINKVVQDGKKELEAMGEVELSAVERKQQLMVAFDNLKGTIGDAFLPVMESLMETIVPLVGGLVEWGAQHPELIKWVLGTATALAGLVGVFGAVGLALGPIKLIIGGVTSGFGVLSTMTMGFVKFIPTLISALTPLASAIMAISRPVWVVIGAITALGVAYSTNLFGFRDAVNAVWEKIKPILTQIGEAFMILVQGIIQVLGGVIDFLQHVFEGNWEEAWNSIKSIFQAWYNTIVGIFGKFNIDLPGIITKIRETITGLWNSMLEELKTIVNSAVSWITDKVQSIINAVQRAKNAAANFFGGGSSGNNYTSPTGARASGGMVLAGQLYRVNELGTEYFRPSVNGTIFRRDTSTPNIQLTFGEVHIHGESDMNDFADKVRSVMMEAYRNISLGTY